VGGGGLGGGEEGGGEVGSNGRVTGKGREGMNRVRGGGRGKTRKRTTR